MNVEDRIARKLQAAFVPTVLDVRNESSQHNVPRGSETHFKVVIVSSLFENKNPVARHQLVYAALAEELQGGVHALTITSRTPAEWLASSAVEPSPPCLGGSAKAETKQS